MKNVFNKIAIALAVILLLAITVKVYAPSVSVLGGTTNLDSLALSGDLTVGGAISTATLTGTGTTTISGNTIFDGGVMMSSTLSTTTPGNMTLKQSDILNYSTILMNPTIGSITVTMPASSTLTSFIPTAGDSKEILLTNATSTAAIAITVAGSTGVTMYKATTTATVTTGTIGVLKFVRKANTDISMFFINSI